MSIFNTQFSGAPFQVNDYTKAREFMERKKQADQARADQAKTLAEDQKRLGMMAQGMGLQKGETDAMSRGELQGFISSSLQSKVDQQAREQRILELDKFLADEQKLKADQAFRMGQQNIQAINAKTANINAKTADRNSLINFNSGTNNNNDELQKQQELQLNEANYAEYAVNQFQNALNGDPGAQKWVDQNREVVEAIKQGQSNSEIFKLKGKMNFDYMSPSESLNIKSDEKLASQTATQFADYQEKGGSVGAKQKIRVFSRVIDSLKSGDVVTGKITNLFGDAVRKYFTDPEGFDAQQAVEKIIAETLRETLGAQFTAREAEQLLKRAYDPDLPSKFNIQRLERAIIEITERTNHQVQWFDHFKKDPSKIREFKFKPTFQSFAPPASSNIPVQNFKNNKMPGTQISRTPKPVQ